MIGLEGRTGIRFDQERRERTLQEYKRLGDYFLELIEYIPLIANLDDPR